MTKIIYMLRDQDDGSITDGPLLGEPGLDLTSLANAFRDHRYAQSAAKGEDYCFVNNSEFVSWLIEKKVLSALPTETLTYQINTHGDHRYVPAHWPLCPSCGVGRGEDEMGQVFHDLNRSEWHRKCTSCNHIWDCRVEPYHSNRPMLDDDGRYIPNGCVPYAISKAGGLALPDVLEVCLRSGWSEIDGMDEQRGIHAAQMLGLKMVPAPFGGVGARMVAGKPTLRKLISAFSPVKSYIIATRGHWLAFVNNAICDPAGTSLRTEVLCHWEVQRARSKGRRNERI